MRSTGQYVFSSTHPQSKSYTDPEAEVTDGPRNLPHTLWVEHISASSPFLLNEKRSGLGSMGEALGEMEEKAQELSLLSQLADVEQSNPGSSPPLLLCPNPSLLSCSLLFSPSVQAHQVQNRASVEFFNKPDSSSRQH